MLKQAEVSALMKSVADVVREFVSRSVDPITQRMDEIDARVKAIPAGKDGKDGKDATEDCELLVDVFVKGLQEDSGGMVHSGSTVNASTLDFTRK